MSTATQRDRLRIALAGQPNTGKSTVFNRLTGSTQHVGNWPGKTVEKMEGRSTRNGTEVHVTDLPGTYSLTASSLEEKITRDFLLDPSADVVVVVVDASQLTRSLYMVAEVLLLPVRVVIALNMIDVAESRGRAVDAPALERAVKVPVVPLVAARGEGIDRLLDTVIRVSRETGTTPSRGPDMSLAFGDLIPRVADMVQAVAPPGHPAPWLALKLIERDRDVAGMIKPRLSPETWEHLDTLIRDSGHSVSTGSAVRYDWITEQVSAAVPWKTAESGEPPRFGFDGAATHPLWGKLIAGGVLAVSIVATYVACLPPMLLGLGLLVLPVPLRKFLSGAVPDWLVAMLCDGLLTGLGVATCVVAFIAGVFLVLGFLEDVGYLARLSFVFDRFMGKLGLHGKSFIPLTMGFVCNIMAVSGTRVIDGWRQRLITLLLAPLIPCKGLLVVISFIGIVFFGPKIAFVFGALLVVMCAHLLATSLLLRRVIVRGAESGMIMELPPYHKPNFKTIRAYALTRVKGFFRHGFGLIVAAAFLTWVGVYYPDGQIDTSYLARFGRAVSPLGNLMGMDWRLFLTFLVAFSSKEATLGAMAVIYGASNSSRTAIEGLYMDQTLLMNVKTHLGSFLTTAGISEASALAFIFAIFFSLPCIGTLATLYGETRSFKWTFGALGYYFLSSLFMGAAAYQVGRLIWS